MHQRTEAFNRKFGGLNPLVKSIIFVNGEYDPNESLQIRTPLNNRTLVINIAGELTVCCSTNYIKKKLMSFFCSQVKVNYPWTYLQLVLMTVAK